MLEGDLVVIDEQEPALAVDVFERACPFAELKDVQQRRVVGLQQRRADFREIGLEVGREGQWPLLPSLRERRHESVDVLVGVED